MFGIVANLFGLSYITGCELKLFTSCSIFYHCGLHRLMLQDMERHYNNEHDEEFLKMQSAALVSRQMFQHVF